MLESKLSEKLYQTHRKLWDFTVLDFKPEVYILPYISDIKSPPASRTPLSSSSDSS